MSARLLLVEDDAVLGVMLRRDLLEAGYDCDWEQDGARGLAAFTRAAPDLVLLDVMLPGLDGFQVLEGIRATSQVPVILLTAQVEGQDKVRGLDLGADDYITKPFWTQELLARVRAALRRAPKAAPALRVFGACELDPDARRLRVRGEDARLTPTEFDLLVYLVEREGRAVQRQQLVDAVLGSHDAGEQALQVHMSRLRRKLGPDASHLMTVWGVGYRFESDAP